jgi:hypothetical protein
MSYRRNIRNVSLAALAVLATMAFVGAGTASAESPGMFEAEEYPVTVKASKTTEHVFTVNSGTTECEVAEFEGEASEASNWLKISPTYTGCTSFGEGASVVEMRGCEYEFHAGAETGAGVHNGTVDVISKPGRSCAAEPITVRALTCTVTVGPQAGLAALTFRNINEGSFGFGGPPFAEVEVETNVSGIEYTEHLGCLLPGTHTNGTYTGNARAKGFNGAGAQIGIRVN